MTVNELLEQPMTKSAETAVTYPGIGGLGNHLSGIARSPRNKLNTTLSSRPGYVAEVAKNWLPQHKSMTPPGFAEKAGVGERTKSLKNLQMNLGPRRQTLYNLGIRRTDPQTAVRNHGLYGVPGEVPEDMQDLMRAMTDAKRSGVPYKKRWYEPTETFSERINRFDRYSPESRREEFGREDGVSEQFNSMHPDVRKDLWDLLSQNQRRQTQRVA